MSYSHVISTLLPVVHTDTPTIFTKMHSIALPLVATIFFGMFASAIPLPQSIPSIPSLPGSASAVTKVIARTVGNDLEIHETHVIAMIISKAQSKILL